MRKLMLAGVVAATALTSGVATFATVAQAQPVVVERYGHWEQTWGEAPPAPMHKWRHWRGHEAEWNGHVHNCMVKYHGYDARRDMYREGRRWVACRD